MQLHALCSIFPKLDESSFLALKEDIEYNGLRNPIIVKKGKILDGQNRFRACTELGIKPVFEEYKRDDLVEFVLAQNLHRRHLTAGQSATIVALAQDWSIAHQKGAAKKDAVSETVAVRSDKSGASERTQRTADKLVKENPDLAKLVASGELTLGKAMKEVEPEPKPDPEQSVEDGFDVVHAYEEEVKENKRLHETIEALTSDNKDKEIIAMSERIKGLEGRLNQALATESEAIKQSKFYAKILTSIRKVLGVENNNDILIRIKAMK